MKFDFEWKSCFGKDVLMVVNYMYIAPWQGQATPVVKFFIQT